MKCFDLSLQESESIRISNFYSYIHFYRKFFIWLAQLISSMGIGTILTEVTLLLLFEVLANLGLVVIVWYVKHLVLDLDW